MSDDERDRVSRWFREHAKRMEDKLRKEYPRANRDDLGDAVIDAMVQLGEKADCVTRAELDSKARDNLRSTYRSGNRRFVREQKARERVTKCLAAALSPLDRMANAELAALLFDEMTRNPDERSVLFEWMNGYTSAAEIAERADLPPSQVTTILARLRKRFERYGDGNEGGDAE